jgi:hypothetical protein
MKRQKPSKARSQNPSSPSTTNGNRMDHGLDVIRALKSTVVTLEWTGSSLALLKKESQY